MKQPKTTPLTPEAFQARLGIPTPALERLKLYAALLVKWQARINLVSNSTLPDLWRRHFLDSAQLWPYIPSGTRVLVDMGSGAGFPGLVLAALGVPEVHLIESDQRKIAFLREAARAMEIVVHLHPQRIEAIRDLKAEVITARALAPLEQLLAWAELLTEKSTLCLFLKGQDIELELTAAHKIWNMSIERISSLSDPSGNVLKIWEVSRG